MPTIKNKTPQLFVLSSPGFETVAIARGQARPVSDGLWAKFKDTRNVKAMIEARGLIVIHDASEPKAAPIPEPAPPSPEEKGGWKALHWKKAEKLIAAETDAGTLRKLLENEDRPKFKKMLSARIEELESD